MNYKRDAYIFGTLLDKSWTVYRNNIVYFVRIFLVLQIPFIFLQFISQIISDKNSLIISPNILLIIWPLAGPSPIAQIYAPITTSIFMILMINFISRYLFIHLITKHIHGDITDNSPDDLNMPSFLRITAISAIKLICGLIFLSLYSSTLLAVEYYGYRIYGGIIIISVICSVLLLVSIILIAMICHLYRRFFQRTRLGRGVTDLTLTSTPAIIHKAVYALVFYMLLYSIIFSFSSGLFLVVNIVYNTNEYISQILCVFIAQIGISITIPLEMIFFFHLSLSANEI